MVSGAGSITSHTLAAAQWTAIYRVHYFERVAKVLEKRSSTTHEELKSQVGLFSFAAKDVYLGRAFLWHLYDTLAKGGKYLHWSKLIGDDLLWWEKFLPQWSDITLLQPQRQCYSLWTDACGFCGTGEYFLPEHYTLEEFRENIPTCNKIYSPSGVTGFRYSEAAWLSRDKAFSYHFSTCQQAKYINFKRWRQFFKR